MCLPIAVTLLSLAFTVIIRLSPSNQILLSHMYNHSFIKPAETWWVSKGEWGHIYPCHLRGFYPTLHNSHLPLFTHRSLQYVTTFTCIWFCFNLYVLDKRKRAIEKSLKEKVPQQPSNCKPPTTTTKNLQKGKKKNLLPSWWPFMAGQTKIKPELCFYRLIPTPKVSSCSHNYYLLKCMKMAR